jgi:hypothetical protein
MKHRLSILLVLLVFFAVSANAEDVTTVEAESSEIAENLDLNAVASVFGEAENLEDFEKRLNDPDTQISNLDLNEDGEVDYLRVIETSKGDTHLVTIQAVIGEDKYQDVANIDVEKDSVQVVGDVAMYGPNYIVEPVYVHPPVIFVFFWGPVYHPWHSPYYWGYYPPYYRPWHPYPRARYRRNVDVHINVNNTYNVTSVRKSKTSVELSKKSRRTDAKLKPLDRQNIKSPAASTDRKDVKRPTAATGKKVQTDWEPPTERGAELVESGKKKVSVPAKKSSQLIDEGRTEAAASAKKEIRTSAPVRKAPAAPARNLPSRPSGQARGKLSDR